MTTLLVLALSACDVGLSDGCDNLANHGRWAGHRRSRATFRSSAATERAGKRALEEAVLTCAMAGSFRRLASSFLANVVDSTNSKTAWTIRSGRSY